MRLEEIRRLHSLVYLTWRQEPFIHKLNQTEHGKEYLDNAWRCEQTKPDRVRLREKLRKEGAQNGE